MLDALYTAATGMLAQQTAMDTTANNLTNVNTVGFKGGRTAFGDLLYTELGPHQASRQGNQQGLGVQVSAVQTQGRQGALQDTGNPSDVAIEGEGLIAARRADGIVGYTRAGNLTVDGAGQLVTASGDLVQPPIRVPAGADMTSFTIAADGAVSVKVAGATRAIGRLQLAVFANPAGLASLGGNLFAATADSGAARSVTPGTSGAGLLRQGRLEMSNVNAADEMVSMIATQRAYDAVAKVVSASDEMLGTANGLRH